MHTSLLAEKKARLVRVIEREKADSVQVTLYLHVLLTMKKTEIITAAGENENAIEGFVFQGSWICSEMLEY